MEENKNIKPKQIARTGVQTNNTADVFSAMYQQQKTETENKAIEDQIRADSELYAPPPTPQIPVVSAEKPDKDKIFKIIFIILIILTVGLLIASCLFLFLKKDNTKKEPPAEEQTTITNADALTPGAPENIILNESASVPHLPETDRVYGDIVFPENLQEKYKNLYAQNQDFVGWINVPNTSIDMPVYKCSNNSYYLKHDNYDTYTKYGAVFMDMHNNPNSFTRNTTLYGHNFDNKVYFDELHNYQDLEFFKKSPVIEFNTPYKDYKWKVIAAFHTNGSSAGDNGYLFYYISPQFGNNSFMKFYDELQQRSYIHTGVDVEPTDKILTLSTCTYFFDRNGALENARFVVVARLVRDGESAEVDTSKATLNDNVRYPQLYYDVFGGKNPWKNASKWVPEN